MRRSLKFTTVFLTLGYFVACAPVKFDQAPVASCGSDGVACVQSCKGDGCIETFSIERTIGQSMVDILIIDDNSGSMSPDQAKLASRFSTFLNSLSGMDYRIAITTTDISSNYSTTPSGIKNPPSSINGNGALQDGNLITFGNGASYLDASTSSAALFNKAIVRQETIDCENSGYKQCPSDDERGIFAANLVLDRTASQFMRPLAPLAIIVLSNEDERSLSDSRSVGVPDPSTADDDRALMSLFTLEKYDLGQTLIERFHSKYPGKTLAVHSLIVKPGDNQGSQSCLAQESNPAKSLRAKEGYSYSALSQQTGGVLGSICDNDYGAQLSKIGDAIQKMPPLSFSCRPINDQYTVTYDPQPAVQPRVRVDFTTLQFEVVDQLPALTKVKLTYSCKTSK
jgi:hypothetical protein